MRLPVLAMILAAALSGQQARAQASHASAPDSDGPARAQRVAQASDIGRLLFLFDRAAWVSSDTLTSAVPKNRLSGPGGYVVELADTATLRVTYFRGNGADARAFFVADVQDGKVVHQDVLSQPMALSQRQATLARAREIAADRARERGYKPCTSAPFNTVVMPSQGDGPIAVYLLTAQQDGHSYVVGGNYRVVVAPDGSVVASRPYSVTCLNLAQPKLPAGAKPVGFVINHLLDPVPTELHVFASYSLSMPVFVSTPDHHVWKVEGSKITLTK